MTIEKNEEDARFTANVLATYEAIFTRNKVTNIQNAHLWSFENPHETVRGHYQHCFSLNVWARILNEHYIGSFILLNWMNCNEYVEFLRIALRILDIRRVHDGAPPHYGLQVRKYLNQVQGLRWIGRGVPVYLGHLGHPI